MASPNYWAELATVLPSRVPAHQVVAVAAPVTTADTSRVIVDTDVGTIEVVLSPVAGQGWRVRSVVPHRLSFTGSAGSSVAPTYTPLPTS